MKSLKFIAPLVLLFCLAFSLDTNEHPGDPPDTQEQIITLDTDVQETPVVLQAPGILNQSSEIIYTESQHSNQPVSTEVNNKVYHQYKGQAKFIRLDNLSPPLIRLHYLTV